jgi:hypothetical protein
LERVEGTRSTNRRGSTLEASKGATKPRARKERTLSFLTPIHPTAWKGHSPKFAGTEFEEVAPALLSLHTWHVDQRKAGPPKGPALYVMEVA